MHVHATRVDIFLCIVRSCVQKTWMMQNACMKSCVFFSLLHQRKRRKDQPSQHLPGTCRLFKLVVDLVASTPLMLTTITPADPPGTRSRPTSVNSKDVSAVSKISPGYGICTSKCAHSPSGRDMPSTSSSSARPRLRRLEGIISIIPRDNSFYAAKRILTTVVNFDRKIFTATVALLAPCCWPSSICIHNHLVYIV